MSKPLPNLGTMTKRELLVWAEENGILLSTATRGTRKTIESTIRILMQRRNREAAQD